MAISYTKTNWNNDTDPPINAENLNKIESGIESCVNGVNGALPLSGGTLTGDLSIINYKKLKFTENSYFQNQATARTALYGDLKMENGNVILGTGLSINRPADTTVFNGIQIKGNVRLDDGLLYMNGKRIALVAAPSVDTDAANKKYVDDQIATIDTSNYVEKTTQANKAYGTNPNGTPKLWGVGDISVNYLVNRTANGNIFCPAVNLITNDNYAASKKYVDTSSSSSATIDGTGLISYKNSAGTTLFTLQLPIYNGGVS